MVKKSKKIYLLGSVIIALASLFLVYFLLIVTGVVQVKNEYITITSGSIEATYNGNPVKCEEVEVTEGELRGGHSIKAIYTGVAVNVGSVLNSYSFTIVDSEGIDVTDKYNVNKLEGTITVNKRPIALRGKSASKEYDGTPLICNSTEYEWVDCNLIDGHYVQVQSYGERTTAGVGENNLYVRVYDSIGNEMTQNYDIQVIPGDLTVTKIPLSIYSSSVSKRYDGMPLTDETWYTAYGDYLDNDKDNCPEIDLNGDGKPEYEILAKTNGTRTEPGWVYNDFEYIKVVDFETNKVDYTENFEIDRQPGKLTVESEVVVFTSSDRYKEYDGEPFFVDTEVNLDEISDEKKKYLLSKKDVKLTTGTLFEGHTWDVVFEEYPNIDAGKYDYKFKVIITDENGKDITENYDWKCVPGKLEIKPLDVFISTDSVDKIYDGKVLSTPNEKSEQNLYGWSKTNGELLDGHVLKVKKYAEITDVKYDVYGKKVIGVSNIIDFEVIDEKTNKDVTDNYEINLSAGTLTVYPAELVVITPSKNVKYNGQSYTYNETDWKSKVSFEGVEEKFPDYTFECTGLEATLTPKDVKGVLIVPKIKVMLGTKEVKTGNFVLSEDKFGMLKYDQYKLQIQSGSSGVDDEKVEYKVGIELQNHEYILTHGENELIKFVPKEGEKLVNEETYSLNIFGSDKYKIMFINNTVLKEVKNVLNAFTVKIFLEYEGQLYEVQDLFNIEKISGSLKISKKVIEVDTKSITKIYDGKECFDKDFEYNESFWNNENNKEVVELLNNNELKLSVDSYPIYVNAGTYDNKLTFKVYDKNGKENQNYEVKITNLGKIKIEKFTLILATETRNFTYAEGTSYSEKNVSISNGMIPGLIVSYFENGNLNGDILYDFTNMQFKETYELPNGDILTISNLWTSIDLGSIVNKPNGYTITNSDFVDTSSNYSVNEQYGYINVKGNFKYDLTVKPVDISVPVVYDSQEYANVTMEYAIAKGFVGEKYTVKGLDGLINEGYTYEATFKYVGNVPNNVAKTYKKYIEIDTLIIYDSEKNDVTDQYTILYKPEQVSSEEEKEKVMGTITVHEYSISIKSSSYIKTYDGADYEGTYEITAASGFSVEFDPVKFNEVGVYLHSVKDIVKVYKDGIEVTDQCYIVETVGHVVINPKNVQFEFVDYPYIEKYIEIIDFINGKVKITIDDFKDIQYNILGLVPGHKLVYFETEDLPCEEGEFETVIKLDTIVIEDEDGNNVTKNYIIDSSEVIYVYLEQM